MFAGHLLKTFCLCFTCVLKTIFGFLFNHKVIIFRRQKNIFSSPLSRSLSVLLSYSLHRFSTLLHPLSHLLSIFSPLSSPLSLTLSFSLSLSHLLSLSLSPSHCLHVFLPPISLTPFRLFLLNFCLSHSPWLMENAQTKRTGFNMWNFAHILLEVSEILQLRIWDIFLWFSKYLGLPFQ